MWAWIGPFLAASLAAHGGGSYAGLNASAATFLVIAIGALGCWIGGRVSDRWGRTALTMISMAASGICALAIGFTFDRPARVSRLAAEEAHAARAAIRAAIPARTGRVT